MWGILGEGLSRSKIKYWLWDNHLLVGNRGRRPFLASWAGVGRRRRHARFSYENRMHCIGSTWLLGSSPWSLVLYLSFCFLKLRLLFGLWENVWKIQVSIERRVWHGAYISLYIFTRIREVTGVCHFFSKNTLVNLPSNLTKPISWSITYTKNLYLYTYKSRECLNTFFSPKITLSFLLYILISYCGPHGSAHAFPTRWRARFLFLRKWFY